jgi:hypothetical protein
MRGLSFRGGGWLWCLAGVVLAGLMPAQARANLVLTVTPVTVAAGSSGDSFEVDVENNASTAQNVAAFSLGISVTDADLTFTGGSESPTVDPYIFAGDSFDVINSFAFATLPTAQSVEASDLSNSFAGTNIAGNDTETLALGVITFNISSSANPAVPITVTLAASCGSPDSCTSFSDSSGANITSFVVNPGTISVTATVPEPSTLGLSLLALPAIVRRRRKAR